MPRLRPLFHPRLVKARLAEFAVTPEEQADLDARHQIVLRWVAVLRSGELAKTNEVKLHGDFCRDILAGVLGYPGLIDASATAWNLMAEQHVGSGGKSADAALGFFTPTETRVVCPVELKGAKQQLDSAGSRALTPVQQAWDYAAHSTACRYILVSNYEETRLYSKQRTPDDYEVFRLAELADREAFRRFYFLLGRPRLLGDTPGASSLAPSPIDELLAASSREEFEVTRKLYADYHALRLELYAHLQQRHSNQPDRDLLRHAQKILDRVLFVAFAEDRRLLPDAVLHQAASYRHPFRPDPVWRNFVDLFRAIDQGNPAQGIPGYNGGLFRPDEELDALDLSDAICERLATLGRYDFHDDVSVEVLGHIFEQSITDLEKLRAAAEAANGNDAAAAAIGGADDEAALSKRKKEGVFYTPSFITRYLVEETLGKALGERWQAILDEHKPEPQRPGKTMTKKQQATWLAAWEEYAASLGDLRVLDLSCGSGAFLVAAFDRLLREYERVNASLAELRSGQTDAFLDLNKTILNANLYGVDLNDESIEITKLSLWLKTAVRGKKLTDLDRNVKYGNSVVADVMVDARAFDWATGNTVAGLLGEPNTDEQRQIDARWQKGFDIVVGNPPYVRQELLGPYKDHWKQHFRAYSGVADLYVYFFERALEVLRPGGRLGYIVTNKWLRAGYAEPLRGLLARHAAIERVVDFGHAPIFEDADVFPSLLVLQKLDEGARPEADASLQVTVFPRAELGKTTVEEYVENHRHAVPQARLGSAPWSLEPSSLEALMEKLRRAGPSLVEYAGCKPYRGVLTGYNEAFIVDTATRDRLVRENARSAELLKKFLRGQDIARWTPEWDGQWMIALASSENRDWPWAHERDLAAAEAIFAESFPALYRHLKPLETRLRKRTDQGRYWWELRSCAYYELFDKPKIVYQEIQFHSWYAHEAAGFFLNNKAFLLPADDCWLVALLNSPLLWWHNFRYLPHMKDEALSPSCVKMEKLPIARPNDAQRELAERNVPRLCALAKLDQRERFNLADSLRMQFNVEKPGQKLLLPFALTSDEFVKEVGKRRPKKAARFKGSDLGELRALYDEMAGPMREREQERVRLERELAEAVDAAYGLTPDEVRLYWETAPPRMPLAGPG